jgi:sugar phosphate isomerase/epimerase
MAEILIQPRRKDFSSYYNYIIKNNLGIEVVELSNTVILNDTLKFLEFKNFYKKALNNFTNLITYHGAFIDLKIESPDRSIRLASRKRVIQSIEAAKEIGAEMIVFHSGYNPIINNPYYISNFVKESISFWKKMIEQYDIKICIENMWDNRGDVLLELMEGINDKRAGICLDVGHMNIYEKSRNGLLIKSLGRHIKHIHMNDNNGSEDEHLAIGDGSIRWPEVSNLLEIFTHGPSIVIEVQGINRFEKSYKYLQDYKVFPYHKKRHMSKEPVFLDRNKNYLNYSS